jgi:hypothetical protein
VGSDRAQQLDGRGQRDLLARKARPPQKRKRRILPLARTALRAARQNDTGVRWPPCSGQTR